MQQMKGLSTSRGKYIFGLKKQIRMRDAPKLCQRQKPIQADLQKINK